MNQYLKTLIVLFAVLSIAGGNLAYAVKPEPGHAEFKQTYQGGNSSLNLFGLGIKKFLMMKVFVAALYLPELGKEKDPLAADMPKHLEVEYLVSIPGYKLSNFTIEYMKRNATKKEFALLVDKINIMKKFFVNLKPGDRYALSYEPGVGTKFLYNGELQGIIPGEDFSRVLFSVWFGEKPFDRNLKRQMLSPIQT